ncbi:sulfotransferase family 2 domain-containing protein [Aeoliella sp.]|uniref:sulfotransferase family 2 domain-containing protein n=1 Tax=Aeoliella sp. TaxID=2795800 RepID=UPI003CCBF1BE
MPSILVCHRLKLAYVAIPKAACRSIKTALATTFGVPYQQDIHNAAWDRVHSLRELAEMDDYFRFAVVRNPWERLVSCYYDKVRLVHLEPARQWIFPQYGERLRTDMSFVDFVRAVATLSDNGADEHFASQWPMITYEGSLAVDHVTRFEHLHQEWNRLRRRFQLTALPHENKTEHPDYRELYTKELADLVGQRYALDVANLGYDY